MAKKIFALCFIGLLLWPCASSLAAKPNVKRCKVHGEILKKVRVRIVYGLVISIYEPDARTELFPNANIVKYGGCEIDDSYPEEAEVYYCFQCRVAQYSYEGAFIKYVQQNHKSPEYGWWRTAQSNKRLERTRFE